MRCRHRPLLKRKIYRPVFFYHQLPVSLLLLACIIELRFSNIVCIIESRFSNINVSSELGLFSGMAEVIIWMPPAACACAQCVGGYRPVARPPPPAACACAQCVGGYRPVAHPPPPVACACAQCVGGYRPVARPPPPAACACAQCVGGYRPVARPPPAARPPAGTSSSVEIFFKELAKEVLRSEIAGLILNN